MNQNNVQALAEYEQKSQNDWQRPTPFDESRLPVINTDVFPVWLNDFIEGVAEETQTPVDASAMAAIAVLSTVIAGNFVAKPKKSWSETLNTYSVMALDSANRKSSVFQRFLNPITDYEREESERLQSLITDQQGEISAKKKRVQHLEGVYAKKGNIEVLEEAKALSREINETEIIVKPRFITADATPEKLAELMLQHGERISVMSAEGAEVFEMMAGRYSDKSNIDIYLKSHAADYVAVDRMGRDSIILQKPTMTVGLFVQPSVIRDIPQNFQERGLTQRFLYSLPVSMVGYREIEPREMAVEIEIVYKRKMKSLLEIARPKDSDPIPLEFDEDAYRLLITISQEVEMLLRNPDYPGVFKSWLGKLTGQIVRLAALFHVADHASSNTERIPPRISKQTLERANSLRGYFIAHAEAANGIMRLNDSEEDAKYILKRLSEIQENQDSIEYRELHQLVKNRLRAEALKKILNELEERNYIKQEKAGRKSTLLLNPEYFKTKNNPTENVPSAPNMNASPSLKRSDEGNRVSPTIPTIPSNEKGAMGNGGKVVHPSDKRDIGGGKEVVGAMGAENKKDTKERVLNEDGSELL